MKIETYYTKLIESLKLLSLNFNEQKKYFPEFVDVPFEILDTFEKAFMLLPQLMELNKITCKVIPNLLRLHNLINIELRNPNFDSIESEKLCNSEEWDKIRKIARDTLQIVGKPLEKPNPNYI
jgi:hypothetical protein